MKDDEVSLEVRSGENTLNLNGEVNLGPDVSHEDERDVTDARCGIGAFKPDCLQVFARIGAFVGVYSISALLSASLAMYVNSQITMLEKQFGFSSAEAGVLMSCNDIGFLCTVMFAGYLAKKIHKPRGLGVSTMLFGVSGIMCAVPYFLQDPSAYDIEGPNMSNTSTIRSQGRMVPMCRSSNASDLRPINTCSASSKQGAFELEQLWIKKMAFALIAVGMVLQGVGKSPRSTFVTLYIDDAVSKQKTGFYMGIVVGIAIFGPALAYFLGGVFSKMYVNLTSVQITPTDPRWIGAWWLGYLVFGGCAVVFSLPLMLFPKRIRSKNCQKEADKIKNYPLRENAQLKTTKGRIYLDEAKDYGKSLIRIFKSPAYTLLTLASVIGLLGGSGTMAFTPKYFASQYSLPLWKANMIIAGCSILAISIGTFIGGVITRRMKMTPLNTCKLLLLIYAFYMATMACGFFLGCDQPELYGDNSSREPSRLYKLTTDQCTNNCHCNDNAYFPVCGDDGRSYFSPCHAGCTSRRIKDFFNCTCITYGHASAGLCDQGCDTKLYIYIVITFIGKLVIAFTIIPVFIGQLRAVEERDRAIATATQSFVDSALGWMPGPVLYGLVVDDVCSLWKFTCGERQSCKLYDTVYFRNIFHGYNLAFLAASALMVCVLYGYLKVTGTNVWVGEVDRLQKGAYIADTDNEMYLQGKQDTGPPAS